MQVILVYKPIDCKQIFIILVKSITTTLALTSEQIDKTHLGLFQLHILLLGQTFSGWILIIIKFFKKIVSWDNSPKAFGSWTPCGRLGEEVFYLELSKIVLMRLNWLNLSKSSKIRNLAAEWAGSPRWVEFWSSTGSGCPPVNLIESYVKVGKLRDKNEVRMTVFSS